MEGTILFSYPRLAVTFYLGWGTCLNVLLVVGHRGALMKASPSSPPVSSRGTLSKFISLSLPEFPHLQNVEDNTYDVPHVWL